MLCNLSDRATLDVATKIIAEGEHWLAQSQHDLSSQSSSVRGAVPAKFLPGMNYRKRHSIGNSHLGLQWQEVDSSSQAIFLSETETIFIVDMTSHVVSPEDTEEYHVTEQKNRIYLQVCLFIVTLDWFRFGGVLIERKRLSLLALCKSTRQWFLRRAWNANIQRSTETWKYFHYSRLDASRNRGGSRSNGRTSISVATGVGWYMGHAWFAHRGQSVWKQK